MNSNQKKHPCPIYDRAAWVAYQIKKGYEVNFDIYSHALIVGNTGAGKTYLIKSFVAKFILAYPDSETYVCDYKNEDYSFLDKENTYYSYFRYGEGIESFYNRLLLRMEKKELARNRCLLCLDEWNSYITSIDKKLQEKYKGYLSVILNVGRSLSMHVICGVQRADSQFFNTSRDAFTCTIGLGKLSKESIAMLFNDYKDKVKPQQRGNGYLYLDGADDIKEIIVPKVQSMKNVESIILKRVQSRNTIK